MSASGDGCGLTLRGLILTRPEIRSGVSKKNHNPYAIQTMKILAGQRTFNWVQMRAEERELAPVPPIGMIVEIAVDSENCGRRTPIWKSMGRFASEQRLRRAPGEAGSPFSP